MRARALACLILCATGALRSQQLKLELDHLAARASNSVDVSLNGATLQFAAKFLDGKDPDEAKVKKLISNIQGIYIKSFEFKKDNDWSQSDLDSVRRQLRAPEWSRIVGVKGDGGSENAEVYLRSTNNAITGVTILVSEARELTVVNIVGPIDLDALAALSGHLGVPKIRIPGKSR